MKPDAITDIIISHAHWDHVDGVDLFPKATVWIQREEYRYYTGEAWFARDTHGGVDADDMQALLKINTEGRLRFVEGDDQEIMPGIRCYTGGKHTLRVAVLSASKIDGGHRGLHVRQRVPLREPRQARRRSRRRSTPRATSRRRTASNRWPPIRG